MSKYTYSVSSKRYHDSETGHFVARTEVRKEIDDIIDLSSQKMKDWTNSLRNREISIPRWQENMVDEMKSLHMISATAANGGWDRMKEEDWQRVSGYLKTQYDYLENFAEEIFTGEQIANGNMSVRATLYAQAARQTYESERRLLEVASGSKEEANVLGGSDHCNQCVTETMAGWVPIDTLTPVGYRSCGAKCHCTIIYRIGPKDELGSQEESF